eukprot:scaffold91777_cov25-Phaeocystis_antarctica.AAC.1
MRRVVVGGEAQRRAQLRWHREQALRAELGRAEIAAEEHRRAHEELALRTVRHRPQAVRVEDGERRRRQHAPRRREPHGGRAARRRTEPRE